MDWLASNTPLIIGHRGASGDAPENTLAAFELALQQGADGIEFDVRLSADGQVVVVHDATVDRTTNGVGAISKLTLAELQALDAGLGQNIPSQDEVFESFGRSLLYNVEIKALSRRNDALELAVADRVEAHGLQSQVLVSSFSPFSVRRARKHLTRSTMLAHIRQSGWLRVAHRLIRAEADHPHYPLVDAAYMEWARKRGLRVHVWTVNDAATAKEMARLGVHGIISNYPGQIRASLA
jgi:glycerophosphoryl diester phosphodiesterase